MLTITNSTISGNTANNIAGGIYNLNGGRLDLGMAIRNAGGASGGNLVNAGGVVTSHGYNLSSDAGGGLLSATGDMVNTNPLLSPLQAIR